MRPHHINATLATLLTIVFSVALSIPSPSTIYPIAMTELANLGVWLVLGIALCLIMPIKGLAWKVAAPLVFLLGFKVLLIVLSVAIGHTHPYVMVAYQHIAILLLGVLMTTLGVAAVQDNSHRVQLNWGRLLTYVLIGVASFQAVLGWMQYLELHLHWWFISKLNVGGRAYGNLRQFNLYALLMLCGLVATIAVFTHSQAMTQSPKRKLMAHRTALVVLTGLLMGALVLSASRFGAFALTMFFIAGLLDMRSNRGRAITLLLMPAAYFAFFYLFRAIDFADILPYYGTQRALSMEGFGQEANQDRLSIWSAALELLRQQPWLGVGYEMLPYATTTRVIGADMQLFLNYAHNLLLQWALNFGVPAALVLTSLLVYLLWRLRALLRTSHGRLLLLVIVLPLAHEMVEFPLHYAYILLPWCFLVGYALALSHGDRLDNTVPPHQKTLLATSWQIPLANAYALIFCVLGLFVVQYSFKDAMKPLILWSKTEGIDAEKKIQFAYKSTQFVQFADLAMLQMTPPSEQYAAIQQSLVHKVAQFRFEWIVATSYLEIAILNNNLCLAKSIAYRMNLGGINSQKSMNAVLVSKQDPRYQEVLRYLQSPFFIPWNPHQKGNC